MTTVKRTERGWAGHFICAHRCRYHRNTLLELGDVRIVVSTVGNMHTGDAKEPEMIGAGRYYETMAFYAHQDGAYVEADVCRGEIPFKSNWSLDRWQDDDIDLQADAMHEAVVAEISERMVSGRMEAA